MEKGRKDQEVVCFACRRMGHKARQCHFSHKRRMGYHDLFKKIGSLETRVALLKGNKEEAFTPCQTQHCMNNMTVVQSQTDADVNWRNCFMIVLYFRKICLLSKGG